MRLAFAALAMVIGLPATVSAQVSASWLREWPDTDFSRSGIALDEIFSGGPPKDGIPSIDDPIFVEIGAEHGLAPNDPVISVAIDGEARTYPLAILMWHEIVNDTLADVPIAVTYCPLCNSGIVFDRRVQGQVLEFGTTGKLRHSDLVMYDRQTESWWQQFLGTGIVGEMEGVVLDRLPARLESMALFAERHPDGLVQIPTRPGFRAYGRNPYVEYDTASAPFLYRDTYGGPCTALMRVVAVEDLAEAWPLELLRSEETIESDDLVLTWTSGQASGLDHSVIAEGRDVGSVTVQRRTGDELIDIQYDVPFAFAFDAFHPDGVIHDGGC